MPHDTTTVVRIGERGLPGLLGVPDKAVGLIIFAHGSGSSRLSPRNRHVAHVLREAGLATLLFDLLTEEEALDRNNVFDIGLLAGRLTEARAWAAEYDGTAGLAAAYFGASTGAGAALAAAAEDPGIVAIVSRGGRPDLAGEALARVTTPTLLIVGSLDGAVIELNQQAQRRLAGPNELVIVPGAGHLFEEPGAADEVIRHARRWFLAQFVLREEAQQAGPP